VDLRIPSGTFFTALGAIVALTGLASGARAPLSGVNVNLYAGAAMLLFGLAMLLPAARRR